MGFSVNDETGKVIVVARVSKVSFVIFLVNYDGKEYLVLFEQ